MLYPYSLIQKLFYSQSPAWGVIEIADTRRDKHHINWFGRSHDSFVCTLTHNNQLPVIHQRSPRLMHHEKVPKWNKSPKSLKNSIDRRGHCMEIAKTTAAAHPCSIFPGWMVLEESGQRRAPNQPPKTTAWWFIQKQRDAESRASRKVAGTWINDIIWNSGPCCQQKAWKLECSWISFQLWGADDSVSDL